MNKYYLQSKLKSSGTGYITWLFSFHYAYLGMWGIQILFWITLGGFGIWWFIDLFRISSMVDSYNLKISQMIESIERKEKEDSLAKNIALINATKTSTSETSESKPLENKHTIGFSQGVSSQNEKKLNQIDKLRDLKSLLDENIITQEEFDAEKRKILG